MRDFYWGHKILVNEHCGTYTYKRAKLGLIEELRHNVLQKIFLVVDGKCLAFHNPGHCRAVLEVGSVLQHHVQLEWEMMWFFLPAIHYYFLKNNNLDRQA